MYTSREGAEGERGSVGREGGREGGREAEREGGREGGGERVQDNRINGRKLIIHIIHSSVAYIHFTNNFTSFNNSHYNNYYHNYYYYN